jgi:hypothetical protein
MILLLLCAAWTCLILLTLCLCASARLGDLNLTTGESLPRSPNIGASGQSDLGDGEESDADPAQRDVARDAQRRVAA